MKLCLLIVFHVLINLMQNGPNAIFIFERRRSQEGVTSKYILYTFIFYVRLLLISSRLWNLQFALARRCIVQNCVSAVCVSATARLSESDVAWRKWPYPGNIIWGCLHSNLTNCNIVVLEKIFDILCLTLNPSLGPSTGPGTCFEKIKIYKTI